VLLDKVEGLQQQQQQQQQQEHPKQHDIPNKPENMLLPFVGAGAA
jgi:hypothetical protein